MDLSSPRRIPILVLLELPSISCCCVGRENSICNPGFGYCTAGVNLPFFIMLVCCPFHFCSQFISGHIPVGEKYKGGAKFPSLCLILTLWHFLKHLRSWKKKKHICLKPLHMTELANPRPATWLTNLSHFQRAIESMFSGFLHAANSPALNLFQLPSMTKSLIYQKAEKLFSKP